MNYGTVDKNDCVRINNNNSVDSINSQSMQRISHSPYIIGLLKL